MGITLELMLNIAMVGLLTATVFYCWLLNKRIKVLQDSRGELANLLKQFDRSTKRASETMALLQKASKEAGKAVQQRIEKAQYMVDDLSYMMDRANKIADQMEAGIAIARQREKMVDKPEAERKQAKSTILPPKAKPNISTILSEHKDFERTPVSSFATESVTYSEEMIELKRPDTKKEKAKQSKAAPKQVIENGVSRDSILQSLRKAKAGGSGSESAISSLQSLIERVAERTQVPADETSDFPVQRAASSKARSRTERQLMKAMQMRAE